MSDLLPQSIVVRAGDDLPGFAAAVEDDFGVAVDLTDALAFIRVADARDGTVHEGSCFVPNPPSGIVTFDWTPLITAQLGPGTYELTVRVEWADGRRLTAPSDRSFLLLIRPGSWYTVASTHGDDVDSAAGEALVATSNALPEGVVPEVPDDSIRSSPRVVIPL